MDTLREVLQDAEYRRVAVGHFNFSEMTVLKAVDEATHQLESAVVMGEAVALIKAISDEGLRIFLNADHTHSLEKAERCERRWIDTKKLDGAALAKNAAIGPLAIVRTRKGSNRVKAHLTTPYLVEGAANERAARLKETQHPVHLTSDADAHS